MQTQNAMSFTRAEVEVSADGISWVVLTSHGAEVGVAGGERNYGSQHTFDGDVPIVKAGDRNEVTVTARYCYTETADDPFDTLRGVHETVGGAMELQYSPAGGKWFWTGTGILVDPGYPGGVAGAGDIVMNELTIVCSGLTQLDTKRS